MILYHGSKEIVEFPEIRTARYNKDFYFGFYCTQMPEQAMRWATRYGTRDYLNKYEYTENSKLKYLVLKKMTEERIKRIYKYADILHCEPIEKVADEFITESSMNNGNYDNIHDCKYRIPDYWDIGEVYERLIEDCFSDDEILHGIWKVYHSWISDKISNYNTDFYYQPRDYIAACYEKGDVL